ncbi:GGDEF domain-containing protein [Colwellia sp. RE-S-Sl-9]
MKNYELKLNTTRWVLLAVTIAMGLFAILDLSILPTPLHDEYITSRFLIQVPTMIALLLSSYFDHFKKHRHKLYFVVLTTLSLSNIWFIKQAWVIDMFSFPYDGLLIYSVFAFFVLRLDFKLSILYVLLCFLALAKLLTLYPIYADLNSIYLGFYSIVSLICLVGLYTTENSFKRAEELTNKLEEQSQTDQLSGLLNRRAYEKEALKCFTSDDKNKPVSIFLIDIDDFKKFNDKFGHLEGDVIIKTQADILKEVFKRDQDIVGRYGGEEFIVIAPNTPITEAEKMAAQVNNLWQKFNQENEKYSDLSCSIGLVNLKDLSINCDLKSFILQADKALYLAKNSGKNCYKSTDYSISE